MSRPPWRSDPPLPLDLNGPRDVAFDRFEQAWIGRPAIELFADIAGRYPDAVACRDRDASVTFSAMWRAACRLAATIDATVAPGAAVGVLLPNQASYPVAVLACLGAARPCVLIDRNHPSDRVAAIVRDAGLTGVVLNRDDGEALVPAGARALWIDDAMAPGNSHPPSAASPAMPTGSASPDAPSFIVYTSGSTGRPKGIVLSQRAVLHRAAELVNAVHLHAGDRVLSLASPSTIGGLQQVFEVMLCGATLVKLDLQRVGLGQVLKTVAAEGVTMMFSTPAVWRSVARLDGAREALAGLRCIQSSGDVLLAVDYELVRGALPPHCAVLSVYGATEAPALLQWFVNQPPDETRVPVGYPLPDVDLAIVDEAGRAVAEGEPGELVIRSAFTSLGLWQDGKVTPGSLEADPVDAGFKIYRTGDLVRRRSDGLYVVLGRRDRQIKVRGNRVEPAEIETALRRLPAVRDAAVVARLADGAPLLLAFVVPTEAAPPDLAGDLQVQLGQLLPDYMRPRAIHVLEALPLLPGRKVDEAALLAHAAAIEDATVEGRHSTSASPAAAGMVARAWRAAVGRAPQPGRSFADAGGDSLRFLQMIFHLERLARRTLPIERFYGQRDADALAVVLDRCLDAAAPGPVTDAPCIFFFPPGGGVSEDFARFCLACAQRVPVRTVNYLGTEILGVRNASFETIARQAARLVLGHKPRGPMIVAGYSAGGDVAYATLPLLVAAGCDVRVLAIFDTDASGIVVPAPPAPRRSAFDQVARLWRGWRRRDWQRLLFTLLSERLFARARGRAVVRTLFALDPPLPSTWKVVISMIAMLRLFERLHADWCRDLEPRPIGVPVLLFRSDEIRPSDVPNDLGWSKRAAAVRVVPVGGNHAELFKAVDHDELVRTFVDAVVADVG